MSQESSNTQGRGDYFQLDLCFEWVKELAAILRKLRNSKRIRFIGYLLTPILVGVPLILQANKKIGELSARRDELAPKASNEIMQSKAQMQNLVNELKSYPTYLIWAAKQSVLTQIGEYEQVLDHLVPHPTAELPAREISINLLREIRSRVESYNEAFVKRRKAECRPLFAKASVPLDDLQLTSIVTDDKHNFVIASAGSGKTEVLINRIAYLASRIPDTISTNRILALAFQHNAAQEIEKRLLDRFGITDVKVKTFHALGLEILRIAGIRADLRFQNDAAYTEFIYSLYKTAEKRSAFLDLIVEYMKTYEPTSPKQEADFETKEQYYQYLRNQSYSTMNEVRVKSEAEKAIMNFLLSHRLNGKDIKVEYERPAQWMKYRNQNRFVTPKPDFYLPDYDIYLEHWAIGADGNAPRWFANPESYKETMNKKITAYKSHGKILIETTAAEFKQQFFEEKLRQKVLDCLRAKFPMTSFVLTSIPYEDLVNRAYYELRTSIHELPYGISRFILIAKTYALDPDKLDRKLQNEKWTPQQVAFAKIALQIFREYELSLKSANQIDFTDMINLAVDAVESSDHLCKDRFDHILVDEYQDLSTQRFRLLRAMLGKNERCKLFAVGDDWQSIMGFAGSNLDFTLRFAEYFDHPAVTRLTINYRSAKSIVDLGAAVIGHNKSRLPKEAQAKDTSEPPISLYKAAADKYDWNGYYTEIVNHCTSKIREYLNYGYDHSDLMILVRISRNPRLINMLFQSAAAKGIKLTTSRRNPRGLPVLSVHKSKGLQARVVFLLNVIDHMYGFPCTIEDLDLFAPAMEGVRRPREEEERRLFYVAVTRAREDLLVYTQECRLSKFIMEVREHFTPIVGRPSLGTFDENIQLNGFTGLQRWGRG